MADEPAPSGNGKRAFVFRPVVAFATLVGSFFIFAVVAIGYCDLRWKDVIMIVVGAVISNFTTVVNWYFGSSEDSSKKTDILTAK